MISIVKYLSEDEDRNKVWAAHVSDTLQKDAEKRYQPVHR